jgi:hypothetical protein
MLTTCGLQQCVFLVAWVGQANHAPAIDLHFPGAHAIDEQVRIQLGDAALKIVASSNFNSQKHPHFLNWTPRRVHADYRKVVAGPHMVVSFDEPRKVETVGGEGEVIEIIIGLGLKGHDGAGRHYPGPVYTIDGEGRVVRHGEIRKRDPAIPCSQECRHLTRLSRPAGIVPCGFGNVRRRAIPLPEPFTLR